ncbi:hypothetical protein QBC39DRAFT_334838 [Podospora conica]|nr:hypothetical protein QBC39DRAFT_334838 [Schizothecium conicum]
MATYNPAPRPAQHPSVDRGVNLPPSPSVSLNDPHLYQQSLASNLSDQTPEERMRTVAAWQSAPNDAAYRQWSRYDDARAREAQVSGQPQWQDHGRGERQATEGERGRQDRIQPIQPMQPREDRQLQVSAQRPSSSGQWQWQDHVQPQQDRQLTPRPDGRNSGHRQELERQQLEIKLKDAELEIRKTEDDLFQLQRRALQLEQERCQKLAAWRAVQDDMMRLAARQSSELRTVLEGRLAVSTPASRTLKPVTIRTNRKRSWGKSNADRNFEGRTLRGGPRGSHGNS